VRSTAHRRAEHQRLAAAGIDMPQAHSSNYVALAQDRKSEAFSGSTSITHTLAGARGAVRAKTHVKKRLARGNVGCALGADRERRGGPGDDRNPLSHGATSRRNVMAGLDPAIHPSNIARLMDHRVKAR